MDKAREDARAFGATEESITEAHGPDDKDCHVWPDNWAAWQAFLAVQTQWNTGSAGYTGLDYTRVSSGLRMAGIAETPELFDKLRIIEAAVLNLLANKDKASNET
jgi:hypothetical protein